MSAATALASLWQARGIEPTVLADSTIGPATRLGTGPTLLADSLPDGSPSEDGVLSTERLVLGALLGRGGMGEVRVAEQVSLRREVATKTAYATSSAVVRAALLKEAWVGAALAHPNVASVHTLARHGDAVAVVMKRIEGKSWASVLADSADLEAQLRVLLQVCRALAFAHEKGILHLDLKPENVMLGEFGEVYVLDWGLACATRGGPAWLAGPETFAGPAGTPSYMAPELAGPEVERIGPRTDVYLLGATLHELVTGRPPHLAPTAIAALAHAFECAPIGYDDTVPRELQSILHQALARDPDQRHASVDAFREAVEGFLQHRHAEHLAARADQTIAEVERELSSSVGPDLEAQLAEIEVALEQTEREWAAHPRLPALAHTLLVLRTRHALAEERLEAARVFHARLAGTRPDLGAQIEALAETLAARARHVQSLEAIGRDLDLTLGGTERQRLFALLGASWAVVSLVIGALDRRGLLRFGYRELLIEGGLLVAVLVPYGVVRRRTFFQNLANIRLYGGLIFTAIAVELWWIASLLLGVPVRAAIAATPLFYTYAFATLALVLDRRFARGALALLVTAALAARFPRWALDCIGVGGAMAVALTLHAWRRGEAGRTAPR